MYVTNFSLNTVAIIYMNTNTVVGSPINVGVSPHAIAIDSEHHRIDVTHINNHTVTVIHTNTHQVIGSPKEVEGSPTAIALGRPD